MAFLNEYDLKRVYKDSAVDKLLNVTNNLSELVEQSVSEIKSYIQHRYDPTQIFFDVLEFSTATTYAIGALIQYSETVWVITTTYAIDDRISYEGKIYKSLQGSNLGQNPATEAAYWEFVVNNNTYYSAAQATTGFYPENTTYWTSGDIRDMAIVKICSWLTIYELFSGGNPRTYPDIINNKHDDSIDDLKAYQRGTRTVILPVQLDDDGEEEGHEITYSSSTQKNWDF